MDPVTLGITLLSLLITGIGAYYTYKSYGRSHSDKTAHKVQVPTGDGVTSYNMNVTTVEEAAAPVRFHSDKPDSYLAPGDFYSQSSKNLEKLREVYSQDASKVVTFVGAGLPLQLGITDWKGLLKKLIDKCDAAEQGAFRARLSQTDEFPMLADDIEDHLSADSGGTTFRDTIREAMQPRLQDTSPQYEAMVKAFGEHLTTNFDTAIEIAYAKVYRDQIHSGARQEILTRHLYKLRDRPPSDCVFYLHVDRQRDFFVLGKRKYDICYPCVSRQRSNSVDYLESCLKDFLSSKHIVFVGFSFSDPYLRKCILYLQHELGRERATTGKDLLMKAEPVEQSNPHFLLVSLKTMEDLCLSQKPCDDEGDEIQAANRETVLREFSEMSVYPIVYKKEYHIFVQRLFEELPTLGKVII